MLTKAAIGVIAALGVALALTLAVWVPNLYDSRAQARASLATALDANATLIAERDRYKRDAAAESERAQARQRERDGLAGQVAALRQSLGDSLGACPFTDEQAKAVDEFLRGER